jgi:integrase
MPRQSAIWLRKQTGWYCTTLKGEIVKLSKDKREAERLFHEMMAKRAAEPEEKTPAHQLGPTFRRMADDFLVHTQGDKNERSLGIQTKILLAFCSRIKGIRAAELKGHMVTSWISWENQVRAKKGKKTWNTSTQALAIKTIKAVLNWGVKQGYLEFNPIKKLSSGKVARRERMLTPEERKRISEFVSPDFADFLFVVEQTGARPYTEIARLESRHIDFAAGTATLVLHKTARKTGRPRVLFFTTEVLGLLKKRVDRYPTGLLFRTKRNSGWNSSNCFKWFTMVREKLGIDCVLYHYRHTRISEAIIKGVPVEVVAELVGNTPQIIHAHYAHVGKDLAALRAAAQRAVG